MSLARQIALLIGLGAVLLAGLSRGGEAVPQGSDASIEVWIEAEQGHNGMVALSAWCRSPRQVVVSYRLELNKLGPGGKSRGNQSGTVKLPGGVEVKLSSSLIRLGEEDACVVWLGIFDDGHCLGAAQKWIKARKSRTAL